MTRSQQLRDWLAQQDGPQPLSAFVAAFPDMKNVMHLVTSMKRTGLMVGHKGEDGFLRYGLGKVPADRTKASSEVRAARARAREERKRRAQGRLPLAEYLAIKAAEKAARDADPAVIEARKERQRAKDRNRKRRERAAQPLRARPPEERSRGAKRFGETQALSAIFTRQSTDAPPRETVEEWIARTGRKPEVLPIHACSQPLRFIGHRAENDKTWRERQAQGERG